MVRLNVLLHDCCVHAAFLAPASANICKLSVRMLDVLWAASRAYLCVASAWALVLQHCSEIILLLECAMIASCASVRSMIQVQPGRLAV